MTDEGGSVAASDRPESAEDLFDRYVEEIYHYVLAWTGGRVSAVDLTTQVLRTAVARMDRIVAGADAAELEVRLVALARAAVTKWQAGGEAEGQAATVASEVTAPLFDGLRRLDDSRREALILCELLRYPAERAARLLGCDQAVLDELRETAAEVLWRDVNQAPASRKVSTWERLTVGAALRQAAREWLPPPGHALLGHLRQQLLGPAPARTGEAPGKAPTPVPAPGPAPASGAASVPTLTAAAAPGPGPAPVPAPAPAPAPALAAAQPPAGAQEPRVAVVEERRGRERLLGLLRLRLRHRLVAAWPVLRRRWAFGFVVAVLCAAGIGVITAIALGGQASESSQCDGAVPCLVTTTGAEVSDTVEAPSSVPPVPSTGVPTSRGAAGFPFGTRPTPAPAGGQVPPTTIGPSTTGGPTRTTAPHRTTTTRGSTTTSHQVTTTSIASTTTTTTTTTPTVSPG